MIVRTSSGSIYEIDEDNKCIRRLTGSIAPTPRQGEDNQWKPFDQIIFVDDQMVIVWEYVDGLAKTTVSSPILEVIDVKKENKDDLFGQN